MTHADKGTRILFFFAGASPEYARQLTASDILRIKLLGATPLIPTLIAYIGCGYAISTYYTGARFITWFVAAPICAFIVLAIEVAMNATMSPGTPSIKKGLMSIPRVLFSIVFSLTLALSPKLAIFNGPIKRQIYRQNQEEITRLRNTIDPRVEKLQVALAKAEAEYNAKQATCNALQSDYIKEIDGREGSNIIGNGPAAFAKLAVYNECKGELGEYKRARSVSKQQLANTQFVVRLEVDKKTQALEQPAQPDLMEQLAAWKTISEENSMLGFFGGVILLLFLFLDFMPTWAKITTSVPSYVFAERAENRKKQVNLQAHVQAFKRITEEHSRTLEDAAIKKRQVRMHQTLLWARLRKMDVAFKVRRELENRSDLQQMADQLDMKPFRQTVSDVAEFREITTPLVDTEQQDTNSSNHSKHNNIHPSHTARHPKPYNMKRIA